MSILEKDLAEALVHYRFEKSQGVREVPIEKARTLLRKWYDREHEIDKTDPILSKIGEVQAEALRATSADIDMHIAILQHWLEREMRRRWEMEAQIVEGTDEKQRGHEAATS